MCLGDSATPNYYHYYSYSPCITAAFQNFMPEAKFCTEVLDCDRNEFDYAIKKVATKTLFPIGVALDGHVIYGPFKANGELW